MIKIRTINTTDFDLSKKGINQYFILSDWYQFLYHNKIEPIKYEKIKSYDLKNKIFEKEEIDDIDQTIFDDFFIVDICFFLEEKKETYFLMKYINHNMKVIIEDDTKAYIIALSQLYDP